MNVSQIKAWVSGEYQQATAEVHQFIAWLEGKDAQVKQAHSLLTSEPVQSAVSTLVNSGHSVSVSGTQLNIVPPTN